MDPTATTDDQIELYTLDLGIGAVMCECGALSSVLEVGIHIDSTIGDENAPEAVGFVRYTSCQDVWQCACIVEIVGVLINGIEEGVVPIGILAFFDSAYEETNDDEDHE